MLASGLVENNFNKNNSKESIAKLKIKEYFSINETLTHDKFNHFLEFIGLKEIWSTEIEQNLLWETLVAISKDKKSIDYDSALRGISTFFDEDDGKDITDIYDENIYNINLKDVSLEESDNINLFDNKKNVDNEKYIDEFLNTIHNKQDTLYNIRFINEIFFRKYFNKNNIIDNDKNEKEIIINLDEIVEKIKKDYKFLNINIEILKNYLFHINDDKYTNSNEKENKNYCLKKDLINYVNAIIDLKIEENNKNHNINLNNSNLSNISNNNINGNSIEFSIEKLSISDTNILNCLDGIISQNLNLDFIKLVKKYIENYILYLRQSIYNDIKSKELELEQKINQSKNTCKKCNKDIDKENKKLFKEEMKTMFRKNSKLFNQKNKELSSNKIININEIMKKNKNLSSTNLRNSLSMPKEQKRKYTQLNKVPSKQRLVLPKMSTDSLNTVQTDPKQREKKSKNKTKPQNKILNGNKSRTQSSMDGCIEDITASRIDSFSNNGANGSLFLLETTKLYNDNLEEETSNKNITNKINNNNNNINIINNNIKSNNQLLIYRKINSSKNKKTSNINNIDANSSIDINNESSIKINNEDNYDDYEDSDDNFFNNGKMHSSNNFFTKKNFSSKKDFIFNGNYNIRHSDAFHTINHINNCFNTFAYGPLNGQSILEVNQRNNLQNKILNNFYDFKYLAYSHRVQKLFASNNDKMNINEFFSEEINAYISNSTKQNCELVISYNNFYFLKPDSLECILIMNIKLLESITISSNNFNLIHLSFKNRTDIIIESFQRMEILIFVQKAISKRKLENEIKINTCNKFYFRKKTGKKDTILTFKNKMFSLTPNFENAQKIGVLLKYQENIFSASFHKKLVVLCSLGLLYFNDNYKTPKAIIPIIGTSIKGIVVQTNEKIYCIKLITINDETYIFGSLKKKEILDWKKEILNYKKIYDMQMKQINPNYIRKSSKFESKESIDIFSKKPK